jgi:hypothetical protein
MPKTPSLITEVLIYGCIIIAAIISFWNKPSNPLDNP